MEVLLKIVVNCHVGEEFGGMGLGCVDSCIIAEELAYACTGMETAIEANSLGSMPLLVGLGPHINLYRPEVALGWDFLGIPIPKSPGFLRFRSRGFFSKNPEIPGVGIPKKSRKISKESRNIFLIHKSLKNPEKYFGNTNLKNAEKIIYIHVFTNPEKPERYFPSRLQIKRLVKQ